MKNLFLLSFVLLVLIGCTIENNKDLAGQATFRFNDCTDSDGGINPGTFGSVTFDINYGSRILNGVRMDTCVGTDVKEYFCDSRGKYRSEIFNCPTGCSAGMCTGVTTTINPTTTFNSGATTTSFGTTTTTISNETCSDQNGFNPYFRDYVILSTNTLDDICQDSNVLLEAICTNNNGVYESYQCDNGCLDGACINGNSTTTTIVTTTTYSNSSTTTSSNAASTVIT